MALVVRLQGRTLDILVDGKNVLRYEDTQHPLGAGRIGLRPWARAGLYRNLYVKTADRPQPISFAAGPGDWPATLALDRLPPVVFLARHMLSAPPAVGCDHWAAQPTKPGCDILVIDPARPTEPPRTIFSDGDGSIYDLNLSLDARTIYFSYAKKGTFCFSEPGAMPGMEKQAAWEVLYALGGLGKVECPLFLAGRGIEKTADGKPIPPFGPGDADFRVMLNAIRTGAELARRTPGPDMPGYAGRTAEP